MEANNNFKSGFVALIGRPNVGKSTLLNALAGEKVAIVSSKPQTTRSRQNAVVTTDEYQIAFVDTPGIHKPKSKLSEYMDRTVDRNVSDVDVVVLLVEPRSPSQKDMLAIEKIKNVKCPVLLAINKIDTLKKHRLLELISEYTKFHDFDDVVSISAYTGENLNILTDCILKYLPFGPKYYDDDYLTDQTERRLIEEVIREKTLHLMEDEIPHGVAVLVEKMEKREGRNLLDISAVIFCEKDSHKGMIIGKKGAMLKKIGQNARGELELILNIKINLQLWAKIKKDWRNSGTQVKSMGYDIKKT